MPKLKKYGNITLKHGLFKSENIPLDLLENFKKDIIERVMVTIALLDEAGNESMVWKLKNGWPTKIIGVDFKSDNNEVYVEVIELAHEDVNTLYIKNYRHEHYAPHESI